MSAVSAPLNLLFATTYTGIGGGETIQLNLFRALDPSRYRLTLLTPRAGPFPDAAVELGAATEQLPYRGASTLFVPSVWAQAPVVTRLEALLRRRAIHAVITDYHSLPFIVPAAQACGLPVIWLSMGWWFPIHPWQRTFFTRRIAHTITISNTVREKLLAPTHRMRPESVEALIPGVDIERFQPGAADAQGLALRTELGIGPDTPLIAMLARFQNVKGHDDFLAMARLVLSALPRARFAVAGDNAFAVGRDEAYKRRILQTVAGDPLLSARVTFLGFRPDPRGVMAAADVVVCSSWFESLSMVAIETMAMGRPMVSTNVGGPAETILDGITGHLVPPHSPEQLATRVIQLLKDPGRRGEMGTASREHVLAHFSAARFAEAFGQVVSRCVSRQTAVSA